MRRVAGVGMDVGAGRQPNIERLSRIAAGHLAVWRDGSTGGRAVATGQR
jgi:hypothetical protein